jgi:hypothetical protein
MRVYSRAQGAFCGRNGNCSFYSIQYTSHSQPPSQQKLITFVARGASNIQYGITFYT